MTSYQILLLGAIFLLVGVGVFALVRRGPDDTPFIAVLRLINVLFTRIIHRLYVMDGADPLPTTGPCIVVANHRSGVDPMLVAGATKRWIFSLMAREYYETRGMRWLFKKLNCIPVNRTGNDLRAMRTAMLALRAGHVVGIFPQGGIREPDELDVGKAGVALLAARGNAPVVPLYIHNSFASHQVFKSLFIPSRSRIYCGRALTFSSPSDKPDRAELEQFAADILRAIAELKAQADCPRT